MERLRQGFVRHSLPPAKVASAVALAVAATGCAGVADSTIRAEGSPSVIASTTAGSSAVLRGTPLPDHPGNPWMARIVGTLRGGVIRDAPCLWLEGDGGRKITVVWPKGYAVSSNFDLLDAKGHLVARMGERIGSGGGSVPLSHSPPNRCRVGKDTDAAYLSGPVRL